MTCVIFLSGKLMWGFAWFGAGVTTSPTPVVTKLMNLSLATSRAN
ncbi:MAG: hypothetical protein AAF708_11020 [Deinococcota bacterium]